MADQNTCTVTVEWRQSVEKTLKYYKDKIKTLKSNSKSKLKKLQTSCQREKRVLNNKLRSLELKNEELTEENTSLYNRIKYFEEEESDVFSDSNMDDVGKINIHKIFDYSSKSPNRIPFGIANQSIAKTINKHKLRVSKLVKNSEILINSPAEMDKKSLLIKYDYYKALITEQESKIEQVSDYISDLWSLKRKLKQTMGKCEKECIEKSKLCDESSMEYAQIKKQRTEMYNLLLESVDRLNEIIDEENDLNQKKCKLYKDYGNSERQLKDSKSEINQCSFLIRQYQTFDENCDKITGIKTFFQKEWTVFEKAWMKWDYRAIIIWLNYMRSENKLVLSKGINWTDIEMKMKGYKIDAVWLEKIDKNGLKLIGFAKVSDRQQIYDRIKQLIAKYPNHTGKGEIDQIEGKTEEEQIPIQFLCPLTQRIMMEPVKFVVDNQTYEKCAIMNHLRKYNTSPVTKEKCDDDEFILVPNRKLSREIQAFLYVNPHITVTLSAKVI